MLQKDTVGRCARYLKQVLRLHDIEKVVVQQAMQPAGATSDGVLMDSGVP